MSHRIRILVTTYDYRPSLGGVATCGYELSRALSALPGVDVRVLAACQPGAQAFDRHGFFETARVPLPSSATRAVVPLAAAIARQRRAYRPDAIVNLLWHPSGLATLIARLIAPRDRTPSFVMAHGVELLESRSSLKKRLRASLSILKRVVFRRAAAVLPVSEYTAGLVIDSCGVPSDRVHVVYNGVDPEAFVPAPPSPAIVSRYGLEGRPVFLTVTRLNDYKGVDSAIGALRQVVARHPQVAYLVCGDGPDRPRLEELVRRYELGGHVVLAGSIPAGELNAFYNLAHCFVLLSRADLAAPNVEGFGLVFLEAAACGKPSIAGRSGGIPSAVVDGETGWLVDPADEAAIARVMLACLDDPDLARQRGIAARDRAVREFTWSHMAQRALAVVRAHVRN